MAPDGLLPHSSHWGVFRAGMRDGKLVALEVTPQSRAADVINMLDK